MVFTKVFLFYRIIGTLSKTFYISVYIGVYSPIHFVCNGVYSPTTLKKCSALVENLISKKYPMFLVGLSYFLLSYGANIMKRFGSAKFIYKKRETF